MAFNLLTGNIHFYLTNGCYDTCNHCYMSAVPISKAKYIDTEDMLNFAELIGRDIGLSGGEPLIHPDILEILENIERPEILTSGFALSKRNPKRKELLEALVKSKARMKVASPDEPFHSLTWDDVDEIRDFIKSQGYNPRKLGYSSKKEETFRKVLLASTVVGGAAMLVGYFLNKLSDGEPKAIPIGRGKFLPESQKSPGVSHCETFVNPKEIYISYEGKIQYCVYTVNDGFMNISEVKGPKAIDNILDRLENDVTYQDMMEHKRCYFSKKIRKTSIE